MLCSHWPSHRKRQAKQSLTTFTLFNLVVTISITNIIYLSCEPVTITHHRWSYLGVNCEVKGCKVNGYVSEGFLFSSWYILIMIQAMIFTELRQRHIGEAVTSVLFLYFMLYLHVSKSLWHNLYGNGLLWCWNQNINIVQSLHPYLQQFLIHRYIFFIILPST